MSAGASTPVVCENIGPRERARRRRIALAAFIAGDVLSVALLVSHAPHVWRLAVFVPFAAAAISVLEVAQRVCVLLAANDLRDMDDGPQAIADRELSQRLRARARLIWLQGLLIAGALTAALWFAP